MAYLVREKAAAGVYIHIPFCRRKCRYCDFYSTTNLDLIPGFVDFLAEEIRRADFPECRVDTVYFGGGTPSLLPPPAVEKILNAVTSRFFLQPKAEITLEANPNSAAEWRLKDFFAAGINRINIGVQSFNDRQLSFLGRLHDAKEAVSSLASAFDAGFSRVGMDLIYGLPGQTRDLWEKDLEKAVSFTPDHLSCYMLTIEPNTPLGLDLRSGRWTPPDEASVAGLFDFTHAWLAEAGYPAYEISNFAPDGDRRSRHNLKYWNFSPYIGLGPSAHSCLMPRRWWNHASLKKYMKAIGSGQSAVGGAEELSVEQQVMEAVFLRLRTKQGLDISWFNERFSLDFLDVFSEAAKTFVQARQMELTENRCRLTRSGFRFHEGICNALIGCL